MKEENWRRIDEIEKDPYGIEYKFTLAVGLESGVDSRSQ